MGRCRSHMPRRFADTIEDGETGFLFSDLSGEGLHAACRRAFSVFSDADALGKMRQAAMARRFLWTGSAKAYEKLYGRLTGLPSMKRSRAKDAAVPRAARARNEEALRVAA